MDPIAKIKSPNMEFGSENHKSLTSKVSLLRWALDVVRGFDYGNIQILTIETNNQPTPHHKNSSNEIITKKMEPPIHEKKKGWYRIYDIKKNSSNNKGDKKKGTA